MNRASTSIVSAIAIAAGMLAIGVPGPATASIIGPQEATTAGSETFGDTGQFGFSVPAGVRGIDVELVGGKGADKGSILGGRPAKVTGRIEVVPGSEIFVLVAGSGVGTVGGFNGGGNAVSFGTGDVAGGGGGGASDIRTIASGLPGSLESRLAVAAGGGGAGSSAGSGGKAGGAGGSAGVGGAKAEPAGPSNTVGSGGFGGGVAGESVAGTGGQPGYPYGGSTGHTGNPGTDGVFGQGGVGGSGSTSTPAGGGGGGGGGVFGGGGGGGGGTITSGVPVATGGGGGGGGSFFAPAGGNATLVEAATPPHAKLTYTIPGTEIVSGPPPMSDSTSASFQVESTEPDSSLECSLDGEPFGLCASPVNLSGLSQGHHSFEVRANNSMDNFDPTPATWEFAVDSLAPVTRIDSGPAGPTGIRRPEFRFSSTEPEVEFSCRFDYARFAACAEPNAEIPPDVLSFGPHIFSVRATDSTGNVGPVATRAFEVIDTSKLPDPLPLPPPTRTAPTLKLGRAKAARRHGTASLPVTVSAAGKVSLRRSPLLKPRARRAGGPSTLRLKIVARGKARKALLRKGKAVVLARVVYRPAGGAPIRAKKRVTLRLKR